MKDFPENFNNWYQQNHSKIINQPQLPEDFYKINHTKIEQPQLPEAFLCSKCKFPYILDEEIGKLACVKCGVIPKNNLLVEEKDLQTHSSFLAGRYLQRNHFKEILSQLQGKEFIKHFDVNLLEIIKTELQGEEPTRTNIKSILKQIGMKKLYDHIAYIQRRLDYPVLFLDENLEKDLTELFEKFCYFYSNQNLHKKRKNLLNYNYLIIKFLRLLNRDDLTIHISNLRQKSKIQEYDCIFKEFESILI
jgi:uncharacterized protein YlbG (UPF0298 family)